MTLKWVVGIDRVESLRFGAARLKECVGVPIGPFKGV